MPKLLVVSKDELPIKKSTAYNWSHKKKHPKLVYKVYGVLVFDETEWLKMAAKAKTENAK